MTGDNIFIVDFITKKDIIVYDLHRNRVSYIYFLCFSRVSPLMFGGAVPPGGAHLSVSPGPPQTQRVPSPQGRFSS